MTEAAQSSAPAPATLADPGAARSTPLPADPQVRVLGVRHHGPGSARAVRAALEEWQPDAVLIEGPADADPIAALAGSEQMVPPVALLAYGTDRPQLSAFWPMAVFSPEWQALRWAVDRDVPVRFMDLPASVVLARPEGSDELATGTDEPATGPEPGDADETDGQPEQAAPQSDSAQGLRTDPIAVLAAAGGYDDPERWWDDVIEARRDHETGGPFEAFDAVTEAMAAIRADRPELSEEENERREAHMRQVLRAVLKTGAARIAVICGAWHAPALTTPLPPAAPDARLLRGLPKRKVSLTWIPWTHGRLSYASGYGAGVRSPGWYAHLFSSGGQLGSDGEHLRSERTAGSRVIADWLTKVAATLRAADLPISSAHVIEAVRLAELLAVLRDRPLAGLAEVTDATRSVICDGDDVTLDLVTRRLVVGEALGEVPEDTPTVPLESDLAATCRRLRFKRDPLPSVKDLDLRKPTDVERSALLHRLRLLGIDWGRIGPSFVRNTGTFRETWELRWPPEFAVEVIEAAPWGTTVESAATNKVCSDALGATLPGLTQLLEGALLADLGEAIPALLTALDVRAARDHDLLELMAAFPPLVRTRRYGDVRGTDLSSLDLVIDALLVRICAGLGAVVTSLDDDGATQLRSQLDQVHEAVDLHDDNPARQRWLATLTALIPRADVHGLLIGRMVRLLLDGGRLDSADAAARLERALSAGSEPRDKAAWVEGFLAGSGLLLVHDRSLLALLDTWVRTLAGEEFLDVVALLRRTFAGFASGELRSLAGAVRQLSAPQALAAELAVPDWDAERAGPAVHTAAWLLGVAAQPESASREGPASRAGSADD